MMKTKILVALAASAALSACGKTPQPGNETVAADQPQAEPQGQVYSGTGMVKTVAGNQVTIAHGPIPEIGWPSMSMAYAASPELASEAQVGSRVDFRFRKNGSAYQLTSLRKK